jgi:calcium/proton exchanger cax
LDGRRIVTIDIQFDLTFFKYFHCRLIVSTALVGVCSEFLVASIEDVTKLWHIGETFVGLILIPIVGNAAEHLTAVTVALKNKVNLFYI